MARYSEHQKAALDALMKDNVYEKALAIMVGEDLQALTMDRLAKDVGVSRGTLYNYFDDRDAVVDFVEARTFDPVLEAIAEVAASDLDPEIKLTRIAEWIFTSVYEDSALIVALSPSRQVADQCGSKMERKKTATRTIQEIIRDGIEAGRFKKLSPVVVTEIFVGAISGMIESMALNGEFYRADALVPTLMELFLGGLSNTD